MLRLTTLFVVIFRAEVPVIIFKITHSYKLLIDMYFKMKVRSVVIIPIEIINYKFFIAFI